MPVVEWRVSGSPALEYRYSPVGEERSVVTTTTRIGRPFSKGTQQKIYGRIVKAESEDNGRGGARLELGLGLRILHRLCIL